MKKNVLLVGDVHLHITMGYFKLLSDQYKVDIYWSKKYKKNVNSFLKKKTNFFNHPSGLIYFFLFFKSFKYDFVFISTGPEFYNGIKGLVGILGYLIFVFFHGKKTIMGIRDNKKYFRNNNRDFIERIINFVRNISLAKILCLYFETKTLTRNFKKNINLKKINCFPIYPLHIVRYKSKLHKPNPKILRIGLLGTVKQKDSRRDYDLLINALNAIDIKSQKKIEILLLGAVEGGEKNTVIQKLKKQIKSNIIYKKNYINEFEYQKLTSSCHVLLSINKAKYGNSSKGTGSFFDAISSKKRLITNLRSDRQFEFNNFCDYYLNCNELTEILRKTFKDLDKYKPLNQNVFAKYNNLQVRDQLIKLMC